MSHQEIESASSNEQTMKQAFQNQTKTILASLDQFQKNGHEIRCGLEIEYSLVDDTLTQSPEHIRNEIIKENQSYADVELGAGQIELRTDPIDLRSNTNILFDQLSERDRQLFISARNKDTHILSHGTNPFVIIKDIHRSDLPKYKLVPNFYNTNRTATSTTVGESGVDIGDAAIIGICNSVQANIEAQSARDAIDKVNRSFQIGPMAVSAFANARFLETKDTGIQDIRMIAWEISHDTRSKEELQRGNNTRVGLPEKYYTSLKDYFSQIEHHPFILNAPQAALFVGIGLNWRDARIKVIDKSLVVEFRPVSTQSFPEENFASMMFYVGRLLWSQQENEPLLPIEKVNENRIQAMTMGMDATLWTHKNGTIKKISAHDALPLEISRSQVGFSRADISNTQIVDSLELMNALVKKGDPSHKIARIRELLLLKGNNSTDALLGSLIEKGGIK